MKFHQLIEKIYDMEEESAVIYSSISEISSGDIKDFSKRLMTQELNHARQLKELKQEFANYSQEVPEDILFLLEHMAEAIKGNIDKNSINTIKNFVRHALETEKNSIILYSEIKKIFTVDSKEAKLFEKLIVQEKSHMFFVLKILHTLKGM